MSEKDKLAGVEVDKGGFLKPPIKLGMDGDPLEAITQAWLTAKQSIRKQVSYNTCTLFWIVDQYQKSRKYSGLAATSKKRNKDLIKILQHQLEINGKQAVGHVFERLKC